MKAEIWRLFDCGGLEYIYDQFDGTEHEELFRRLEKDYYNAIDLLTDFETQGDFDE